MPKARSPRPQRAASRRHDELITKHRAGFPFGFTAITREVDPLLERGVDFGIQLLRRDERLEETHAKESVWVLLEGRARVFCEGREATVERCSLFDEAPTALHLGPGAALRILAQSARVEWAVARASNPRAFPARFFLPAEIEPEYRGLGLANGTCLRNVRLIFDRATRPDSELVIGEVVNYPGRWSSYPPHHHAQPEIYHYRFNMPQGYGHGEVGEQVYKLRQFDTLRIPAQHDHAQVAAPGYAMYYLWVVRHLSGKAYTGFEYTQEHAWMLDPEARIWEPGGVPYVRRPASASDASASAGGTRRRPWTRSPGNGSAGNEGDGT